MADLIEQSREIVQQAKADIKPVAVIAMVSGGSDSMAAYQLAKALGIQIDFIAHGVTGTGIQETTDFVRAFAAGEGVSYIEANAGDAYEQYVLRKGFFGRGRNAHAMAYHTLKAGPFRQMISRHIRQGKRHRPVVLLNGARALESSNRAQNMTVPVRSDGNNPNYWVNIIHHWDKQARDEFLSECRAPCNPITKALCRSGECLCGTSQSLDVRWEASALYPDWGKWLNDLENRVLANGFTWRWGEDVPKTWKLEKAGQQVLSAWTPMCVSCKTEEEL